MALPCGTGFASALASFYWLRCRGLRVLPGLRAAQLSGGVLLAQGILLAVYLYQTMHCRGLPGYVVTTLAGLFRQLGLPAGSSWPLMVHPMGAVPQPVVFTWPPCGSFFSTNDASFLGRWRGSSSPVACCLGVGEPAVAEGPAQGFEADTNDRRGPILGFWLLTFSAWIALWLIHARSYALLVGLHGIVAAGSYAGTGPSLPPGSMSLSVPPCT